MMDCGWIYGQLWEDLQYAYDGDKEEPCECNDGEKCTCDDWLKT